MKSTDKTFTFTFTFKIKWLLLFVASISIFGCTRSYMQAEFIKSWIGTPIERFQKAYGEPYQIKQQGNLNERAYYQQNNQCQIYLLVNERQFIVDGRFEGVCVLM